MFAASVLCARADGRLSEHPESFPVNTLVPIEGTPLEKNEVCPAGPPHEQCADHSPFRSTRSFEPSLPPVSFSPKLSSVSPLADTPSPRPSRPW